MTYLNKVKKCSLVGRALGCRIDSQPGLANLSACPVRILKSEFNKHHFHLTPYVMNGKDNMSIFKLPCKPSNWHFR